MSSFAGWLAIFLPKKLKDDFLLIQLVGDVFSKTPKKPRFFGAKQQNANKVGHAMRTSSQSFTSRPKVGTPWEP